MRENAERFRVAPEPTALIGEPTGGHLVSFVGVRKPKGADFAAVVSFYGIHDFVAFSTHYKGDSEVTECFMGEIRLTAISALRFMNASPISHVDEGVSLFLMIHGTKDEGVPFEQPTAMCAALMTKGVECSVIEVDGGHGMDHWEPEPDLHHYKRQMVE